MNSKMLAFGIAGLLLLVAAAAGFYFLGRSVSKNNLYSSASPKPVPPPATPEPTFGTISGTLSYPSEQIPADMQVCAETPQGQNVKCVLGQDSAYSLEVPAGSYYIYATLQSNQGTKAYYSEFVTCGLEASCPSHQPIEVPVMAGESVLNIDPGDWYAPPQPQI